MAQHQHEGTSDALGRTALWRRSSYSGDAGNCVEAAVLGSAQWHKSNYSGSSDNCVEAAVLGSARRHNSSHSGSAGNCVEAAVLGSARRHNSSYSGNAGECVEVGSSMSDALAVRDSKDPSGPALVFTRDEWAAFVARIRRSESGLA